MIGPMKNYCGICKRELNVENDPLSGDCGGDCWGCIGEIEADSGYETSLKFVRQEYLDGYRQDWLPAPIVKFHLLANINNLTTVIEIEVRLVHPLGNPHVNQHIEVLVVKRNTLKEQSGILEKFDKITNSEGAAKHKVKLDDIEKAQNIWIEVKRNNKSWSFPIQLSGYATACTKIDDCETTR